MSGDGSGGKSGNFLTWFIGIVVAVAAGIVVPIYLANRSDDSTSKPPANNVVLPTDLGLGNLPTGGLGIDNTVAHVFSNRTSGAAGSKVTLSGDGFQAGENVTFEIQVYDVGSTTADDRGAFRGVDVTIPSGLKGFDGFPATVTARGEKSHRFAQAQITITG